VTYLLETYPKHALSLDVSTDNSQAVSFYRKMGLKIQKLYMSPEDVEFALFETPLDKRGEKIDINDP
jgi:ribosomal protein S18 acetylase RimI-like enzyme